MQPGQRPGRGRATLQRDDAAEGPRSRGPRPNAPGPQHNRGQPHSAQGVAWPRATLPVPTEAQGRASFLNNPPVGPTTEQKTAESSSSRGAMRGKRVILDIINTRPSVLQSKRGKTGKEVILEANYFRIKKQPLWNVYQYRVDFAPDTDLAAARRAYLRQHNELLRGYIFDGAMLFTFHELASNPMELTSLDRISGEPVKVIIKHVGILKTTEGQYLQILNLILRHSMAGLRLQLIGRNFFDGAAKIAIRDHRLELWPGYITSIRQHEKDIMVCAEIAHKVMRIETVYDILRKCIQESRVYQEAFKKLVVGMVVLTDYNNNTYRVDDVNFDLSPLSKFSTKNGEISFVEYYKTRYNLNIQDKGQPLLVSFPTEKKIRGDGKVDIIMLVPELSRATGLTDDMRSNFQMMKALSDLTRLKPNTRIDRLKAFNRRLSTTRESSAILDSWDLSLDSNLVKVRGRILPQEKIILGNNCKIPSGEDADWGKIFKKQSVYFAKDLKRWTCITTSRNQRDTIELVKALKTTSGGMGMRFGEPEYIIINDDRNGTYVAAIEKACANDSQLIMTVVSNNNAERYSCIKKKCYVDRAVPSQVVVARTIAPRQGRPSQLMSIATKVAIQMSAKLSGAPWMISLPINGLMTVGFDVCHSTRSASKTFGALVATMDLNVSSTYFSTVSQHNKGQELSNVISLSMTKALKCYRDTHGCLPARILLYRDGVGEGQLHQTVETEVSVVRERLTDIYKKANGKLQFAFIIVSKRINTRFFYNNSNPAPGTVVDDIVTLPERYDFYLVSQSVKDGTVSPTSYNIIHDSFGLDPDKMQMLAYKMCHLYYNWCGTTRVPAVCQYAHKLAFLVSQSINQSPSNFMEKQLYYL